MKNIHILPTDKPSRLHYPKVRTEIGLKYKLALKVKLSKCNDGLLSGQRNIYITSDEEIKEGNWFIDDCKSDALSILYKCLEIKPFEYIRSEFDQHAFKDCKKIILTTDTDLIKDNIQPIDDEFLEWFVKNSSCEEVEISKIYNDYGETNIFDSVCTSHSFKHKIIIPKEEPKFEESIENTVNIMSIANSMFGTKEELKQETLEEAAERFRSENPGTMHGERNTKILNAFINGAKWQQEKGQEDNWKEIIDILKDPLRSYGTKEAYIREKFNSPTRK